MTWVGTEQAGGSLNQTFYDDYSDPDAWLQSNDNPKPNTYIWHDTLWLDNRPANDDTSDEFRKLPFSTSDNGWTLETEFHFLGIAKAPYVAVTYGSLYKEVGGADGFHTHGTMVGQPNHDGIIKCGWLRSTKNGTSWGWIDYPLGENPFYVSMFTCTSATSFSQKLSTEYGGFLANVIVENVADPWNEYDSISHRNYQQQPYGDTSWLCSDWVKVCV